MKHLFLKLMLVIFVIGGLAQCTEKEELLETQSEITHRKAKASVVVPPIPILIHTTETGIRFHFECLNYDHQDAYDKYSYESNNGEIRAGSRIDMQKTKTYAITSADSDVNCTLIVRLDSDYSVSTPLGTPSDRPRIEYNVETEKFTIVDYGDNCDLTLLCPN